MTAVSVALATYNGGEHIAEQLASILDQELLPAEILISDDGSTDATLDIARRMRGAFQTRGVTLRILQSTTTPIGPSSNFVRAATNCTSPLIAFCDQDDIWLPRRLSAAAAHFQKNPHTAVLGSDAELVDQQGSSLKMSVFQALRVDHTLTSEDLLTAVIRRNFLPGMTLTVNAAKVRPWLSELPRNWLHDHWLCVTAALHNQLAVLPEPHVLYRQHANNAIGVRRQDSVINPRYWMRKRLERDDCERWTDASPALRHFSYSIPPSHMRLIERKLNLESARLRLPTRRFQRFPSVTHQLARGNYSRVARRGLATATGDLFAKR